MIVCLINAIFPFPINTRWSYSVHKVGLFKCRMYANPMLRKWPERETAGGLSKSLFQSVVCVGGVLYIGAGEKGTECYFVLMINLVD